MSELVTLTHLSFARPESWHAQTVESANLKVKFDHCITMSWLNQLSIIEIIEIVRMEFDLESAASFVAGCLREDELNGEQ